LQDPARLGGDQLNTLVPLRAPSNNGKVQLSIPKTAVPMGNTEITAETGTLFELSTTQMPDPLLFQFGMMRAETFDKVLASALLPKATAVTTTNEKIQTPSFSNIEPPYRLGSPKLAAIKR